MAKLLDRNMHVREAGVKTRKTSSSMPGRLLLPHEYCPSTHDDGISNGPSTFLDCAIKRSVSPKKDKNLMLPHEFFGGKRSSIAGKEILLPHQVSESNGGYLLHGGSIKLESSLQREKAVVLPHEFVGGNRSGIAGEENMLPHQQIEYRSNSGSRFSDYHEPNLKKNQKHLPSEPCQSTCGDEKILLPSESIGNKTDVSDSAIKLKIGNKNDQKLRLPQENCQTGQCNFSMEIKMPHGQDIRMAMNLVAGAAFQFSLCR